jgi:flagellar FliL protein
MSEAAATADDPAPARPRRRLIPILLGFVLGVAAAGGGFIAARDGLIDIPKSMGANPQAPATVFVEVPQVVISLGPSVRSRHLRFSSQVEVPAGAQAEVARLMPRILDVLNGYLRAVDPADLENPAAMVRLRAQMLRRVQMVAGPDRAIDLLITEFVLN